MKTRTLLSLLLSLASSPLMAQDRAADYGVCYTNTPSSAPCVAIAALLEEEHRLIAENETDGIDVLGTYATYHQCRAQMTAAQRTTPNRAMGCQARRLYAN